MSQWERTDKALPDGRPIWECPTCKARIWGHVVGNHTCRGVNSVSKPTTTLLPCMFRGPSMGKVRKPGCDCWAVVFGCTKAESGLCVLAAVEGAMLMGKAPAVCNGCPERRS